MNFIIELVIKFLDATSKFKRLIVNPILMFHAFGGVFRIFGYAGYFIFKPKYMEMQYRQSASGANFFTGKFNNLFYNVSFIYQMIRYNKCWNNGNRDNDWRTVYKKI